MKKYELKNLDFEHVDNLTYVKNRDPRFEARAVVMRHNEEITLHYHDDIEIVCQLGGSSTHFVDGVEYVLKSGELLIINNHTPHYNLPLTSDEDQSFVVIASKNYLNNIVIESGFDQSIIELKNILLYNHFDGALSLSPKLQMLINEMIANTDNDRFPINQFKERLLVGLFILELSNLQFDTKYVSNADQFDLINYLHRNIKSANLSEFAQIINYSPSYVSRRIKKDYDMSFMDILIEIRLQKAARMIISDQTSIEKIMNQIGYNNKTHFYELFKSRYGVTPLTYRNRNKK